MPNLAVTVSHELHMAMARATGEPFAESYLSGAVEGNGRLLPRTQTAWGRLKDNTAAMRVIKAAGLTLVKPPPFDGLADMDWAGKRSAA